MRFLCMDTTRKRARMLIYDDSRENSEIHIELDENIKHSEGVFIYLEKLLFESKLKLSDFDYFSAVVGPGSFTGIRVGMSIIKGFNKCFNKKIIPLNAFEVMGKGIKNGVLLLNSTTTSCYYAIIKNKEMIESGTIDKGKIQDIAHDEVVYILREEQKLIDLEYNNVVIIDEIEKNYSQIILRKIEDNQEELFEPYYIQLSQAERNLNSGE